MPLPSADELVERSHVVALPLVTRFRGITVREAVLLEGPEGWSEFSPFVEYADPEASSWLAAAVEDGWSRGPEPLRDFVPVNATVPAVHADEVPAVLARYDGTTTVKVKVAERGQSLSDDVARVAAVRAALGDGGMIRVDANGGWAVDEAVAALRALEPFGLQYAEQPCAGVDELAALRVRLDGRVAVAADESIRRAADPERVVAAGAADVIVIKAQPLGGARRAIALVERLGLPAVVSSAIDTSVGLSLGARLAAALPGQQLACGLGTASLLAADVTADPLRARGGAVAVRRVVPDAELLARHAAAPERTRWWRERLRRCAGLLAARTDVG
ncbi:o-succinylbenzoate synthase [Mycetocola reblochoni]|uniref:o-succinylbenzoate synthase n=1 Tax=Mycetocola reblochoni TaxID=331618 RepID=A0A3L6ZSZ1_9MICO|nr:o-succinylbenzoate synthase [Mycetocola reblochoni]RLP70929.1 O-succinylbenzoate synthase [Mycetocola reblochoni]